MFIKTFPHMPASEVAALAAHSAALHTALAKVDGLVVPSVLSYNARSITYSAVECQQSLADLIATEQAQPEDLKFLGAVLQTIHAADLRHSDYVPHNVFYSADKVVLIDSHPPEYVGYDASYLEGNPRNEVGRFLFVLFTSFGLKRANKHLPYLNGLAQAFLEGYSTPPLTCGALLGPALRCAKEVFGAKGRAGFGPVAALAHCVLATYFVLQGARRPT